jgi:hypothetical protein
VRLGLCYLYIPDIQRLTLADEEGSYQPRGDVPWCIHCTVVQVGQAPCVCIQGLIFVHHFPLIMVCLTWLNSMGLIAFK